jgi:hypothetical protein
MFNHDNPFKFIQTYIVVKLGSSQALLLFPYSDLQFVDLAIEGFLK